MLFQNTLRELSERYVNQIEDNNQQQFKLLKGLPFYHWNKSKDKQYNTFVGTVGLPVKKSIAHGLYDYEQSIIEYIERDEPQDPKNKHLYILKSSGLGITTLLLYYIGWKCTTNDDWANSRVNILTAPRLELTVDIINRLKRIFTNWNDGITFDTRSTVCQINRTRIEAFPSHLGLKSMRGLTDIKMILCDESAHFEESTIPEVRDIIERYLAKETPIIVLCSTPNRPDDLMDLIRREPEDKCLYNRMYLDYKTGLDRIYTEQEIALQRLSPSFNREYNLHFAGVLGNCFRTNDIEEAIRKGKVMSADPPNLYTDKAVGLDPSFGSSAFGICITEVRNGIVHTLFADEYHRPSYEEMIQTTLALLDEYGITRDSGCRIYTDGSNSAFCSSLKRAVYEDPDYTRQIEYLKKTKPTIFDFEYLKQCMFVLPVHFSKEHKGMLSHAKEILEDEGGMLAIDPQHTKLVTALRTAVEKGEGSLDKEQTVHDDLLDAFRLSLLHWRRRKR